MNDLLHASTLFLVFAVALVLYGQLLVRTGNRDLMPYRVRHTIGSKEDVRRAGRIVRVVGLVIGALAALGMLLARAS